MIGLEPTISHQEFLDVMRTASSAVSVEELAARCDALTDYKYGSYHHIPPVGSLNYEKLNRYWSTGIRQDIQTYLDLKDTGPDPVMKFVFSHGRPFWLSDLKDSPLISDATSQYRIKLALDNIGDGVMVPLFGPYNKRGYVFAGFENPRDFYGDIFVWQVQALLQAVHTRYCILLDSLRHSIKLTPRESEVVELISFGKTNPEIGVILGISTHTVAGHVKRLFLKFNATDRVTVALRARSFTP